MGLQVGTGNLTHAPLTPSIVNYGFEADELSFTANGTAEVGLHSAACCLDGVQVLLPSGCG